MAKLLTVFIVLLAAAFLAEQMALWGPVVKENSIKSD
jgi:hypothetical protein